MTRPILRYFAWSHLPPHLQTISQPFADLAQLVADPATPLGDFTREMDAALERIMAALGPEPSSDEVAANPAAFDEWRAAGWKIQTFGVWWESGEEENRGHCLRLLLEAKDCAVRTRV